MSNQGHGMTEPAAGKCPVMHADHQRVGGTANQHWWPDQLNLRILRQNHPQADPMGDDFDYASAFSTIEPIRLCIREGKAATCGVVLPCGSASPPGPVPRSLRRRSTGCRR